MRTVLTLALSSNSRTTNLCQPIDIIGLDIQLAFQLFTHIFRPRFSPKSTDTQLEFFQRYAGWVNCFCQIQRIGRRASQPLSAKIMHQLNLFLRIATTHRNYRPADILDSGMCSQASCKQAITVWNLHRIILGQTISGQTSCHHFSPDRQIFPGITDNNRLSRRSGRSVQPDNLRHRHGHQPERIIVPQVLFNGKRELHYIVNRMNIFRSNPHFLHFLTVERRIMISVFNNPP